ncbi:MAG TPA: hypothetical protein VHY18_08490 [Solirubrobacteraceae bacterium]|jgi:hypothetical protein|nr:hypothetical protein [Solirubrobacteraceae bacterium]
MRIRSTLSLVVCALLALETLACGASGCGSEKQSSLRSAPLATLPKIETKDDPDEDSDKYPTEQPDRDEVPYFKTEPLGHPADVAETRAAAAVVKHYFADAAHEDGAAACRLLYAPRAETVAAEYGSANSFASKPGATCSSGLSRLFKQLHGVFAGESAGLSVSALRVEFNQGSVQLHLAHVSTAHYIEVHRERGVWKLGMLVDLDRPVGIE